MKARPPRHSGGGGATDTARTDESAQMVWGGEVEGAALPSANSGGRALGAPLQEIS